MKISADLRFYLLADQQIHTLGARSCAVLGVFVGLVPPARLAKICRNERSHNPEHGRPMKPVGSYFVAGIDEFRDYARDEPNYDRPEKMHRALHKLDAHCAPERRNFSRI